MGKIKETALILKQEEIATDIFSMWIKTGIAKLAHAGQFILVYTKNDAKLLPRPISICEMQGDTLRIVYRVLGDGTKEFSGYKEGDTIDILGPLGNGYEVCDDTAILFGGGIGIPPMLQLAKELKCDKTIIVGYRNNELFLKEELEKYGKVIIATDDGSVGIKGNVIEAAKITGVTGKRIYACGPMPMLKGVKAFANELNIDAYISLEERMACGVGACLGCVCKSVNKDEHSQVNNKRICKDGPVFLASEVDI